MKPVAKQVSKSTYETQALVIRLEENVVATFTFTRPIKFNALSEAMLTTLQEELDSIAKNESLRLVILQGAGKVFCAGHDLKEMIATRKETYYQSLFLQCSKMMMTLNQMPQPIIAKVHGIATAAG